MNEKIKQLNEEIRVTYEAISNVEEEIKKQTSFLQEEKTKHEKVLDNLKQEQKTLEKQFMLNKENNIVKRFYMWYFSEEKKHSVWIIEDGQLRDCLISDDFGNDRRAQVNVLENLYENLHEYICDKLEPFDDELDIYDEFMDLLFILFKNNQFDENIITLFETIDDDIKKLVTEIFDEAITLNIETFVIDW